MIVRIKEVKPMEEFTLYVEFDDDRRVRYDMREDVDSLPGYDDLRNINGLWKQVQLDESRTCVYWNDQIDLPSDIIYEYGKDIV